METSIEHLEKAYRLNVQIRVRDLVSDMVLCKCKACEFVPRDMKLELIAQGLIDGLASHLFAAHAANGELTEDSMITSMHEAKKQVEKYFTNFGGVDEKIK